MQREAHWAPLWRGLACLALLAVAEGTSVRVPLRGSITTASSFVRGLDFKRRLRICNAYPYESPLDVHIRKTKITQEPLPYKACSEFAPELHVDDEIDFKVDGTSAGTFTISDLPQNDAVLLMVIYRHSTGSTAVAFESHVFANMVSPQVAVLDTYKGSAQGELHIQDAVQAKALQRSEALRFDNVVAVDPGVYEVLLQSNGTNSSKARADLVALPHESYIVIRCGVDARVGQSYPEELLVYPSSDRAQLGRSSARSMQPLLQGAVSVLLALLPALLAAGPLTASQ